MQRAPVTVEEQLLQKAIKEECTWENLPKRIQVIVSSKEEWHRRITESCIKKRLQWNSCFARKVCKESEYYEEMMRYLRKNLALFPYHLADYICRVMRISPFRYYCDMMFEVMRNEQPYDSIPNFSAADALRLTGIGRNEFIDIMNKCRSKKIMWKLNKSIAKELLPTQPVDFPIEPWWGVCLVNFTLEEFKKLSEEEMAMIDKLCKEEANSFILFDPDVVKGLYGRGLIYFDVPVYPDDRFKAVASREGKFEKDVHFDEWSNNKLSKEAKGREATKIVLMPSFWNQVVFTLKVMAPLVHVLRLVDGERKAAMGYIYEAMEKAKETIMKSFNNIESKYNDVFTIIDSRWTCQLHRPLHAAGHFLNPELFYSNPDMEYDLEVTNGLYDCIRRLVPSKDVQQRILTELPLYKSASGLFGDDFAKESRKTTAPVSRLEGFVSNREQSYEDPIEELLYAVFVVSNENASVAELAATLQADLSQLQAAASFVCRLGWATKVIDPASILQDANIPGSPKSAVSDEDSSIASHGFDNMLTDSNNNPGDAYGPHSSYTRVAFIVDATITSYLMMGSVSPGLKSHAVTLYEAGKLDHAVIADLCKDLSTLEGAKFEGELQEFANHAFSLRCVLECLQSGGVASDAKVGEDKMDLATLENHESSSPISEISPTNKYGDSGITESGKNDYDILSSDLEKSVQPSSTEATPSNMVSETSPTNKYGDSGITEAGKNDCDILSSDLEKSVQPASTEATPSNMASETSSIPFDDDDSHVQDKASEDGNLWNDEKLAVEEADVGKEIPKKTKNDEKLAVEEADVGKETSQKMKNDEKLAVEETDVGKEISKKIKKYRVDILRCESLASLAPATLDRLFVRDYDVVVSIVPLPHSSVLPGSSGLVHFGPLSYSFMTPWMKLVLYSTVASGPLSVVLMKGQCLRFLPAPLAGCEKALIWSWDGSTIGGLGGKHEGNLVKGSILLHCLNSLLKHSAVLVQPLSRFDLDEFGKMTTMDIPLPLKNFDGSITSVGEELGICEEECSKLNILLTDLAEKMELWTMGYIRLMKLFIGRESDQFMPQEEKYEWVPLSVEFGIPLFSPKLCSNICQRVVSSELLQSGSFEEHHHAMQSLRKNLHDMCAEYQATGPAAKLLYQKQKAKGSPRLLMNYASGKWNPLMDPSSPISGASSQHQRLKLANRRRCRTEVLSFDGSILRSYALAPVYEAATRPIEEGTQANPLKAEADESDSKEVILPGVNLIFDGSELHPFDIGACLEARQPISLIAEAAAASASLPIK